MIMILGMKNVMGDVSGWRERKWTIRTFCRKEYDGEAE